MSVPLFRVLDLRARLYERGGERGAGVYPAGLCGDPRLPTLRGEDLVSLFFRDTGRARRYGGYSLRRVGRVGYLLRQYARCDRVPSRRCLRPYRALVAYHGRGRRTVLHSRLRLGLSDTHPAALYAGVPPWGYSGETWFWLFAVTLGPQILGHTVLNWALRYVETSIISGTILAEPVVSAVLAWLVLSERPGLATILGGAVVLAGLFLLLRGYEQKPGEAPAEPVA